MLTSKQHELLLFIHGKIRNEGIAPSYEEMREGIGLMAKSGVNRLLTALEERGYVRKLPNRARAIEVLRLPGAREAEAVATGPTPTPANDVVMLPLYGRVAAGLPIDVVTGLSRIPVPAGLLGAGEHYALEVAGDSMKDAGILDGDYALIRRTETARDGEIVVALIDDAEATLKIFRREGSMVRLDPANRAYDPQRYVAARVRIQGRLKAMLRRY